jgi:hypothetical protein
MDFLAQVTDNLLSAASLFFVLGLIAGSLKSDLEVPESISRYLSLYLMMAIGFKGGVAMANTSEFTGTAIQVIFERGFEKVICIGNDCPALDKNRILEAAEKLQTTDTVLGPDNRGGVYLLGISQKDFKPEVFENLAWQSEKMLESYIEQADNQSILMLESLSDIHTFQELQTYTTSKYFIAFLLQIIEQTISKIQDFYLNLIENFSNRSLSLRAPPIA